MRTKSGLLGDGRACVELDCHAAFVSGGLQGTKNAVEVEVAVTGDPMVVFATADVLDMDVPDSTREPLDALDGIFADADRVADIQVDTQRRVIDLGEHVADLGRALDQERRFVLDSDSDAAVGGITTEDSERRREVFEAAFGRDIRLHAPAGHAHAG